MFVSNGNFAVVIRRSRFASICLMALASAIAVTEYATYKPVVLPDDVEDESSSNDEASAEISENVADDENNADENDEVAEVESQVETTKSDPFTPAGDKEVTISSGDTFASVITNLGFDKTEVYLASKSLAKIFNLRNLKIGQKLIIRGKRDKSGDLVLTGIELRPDYKCKIVVSKSNSGYNAEKVDVPVKKIIRSVSGKIDPKSPAYSLKKCGVKASVSTEALKGLSQIVNIKSSKTPVDFEFLYQNYYDDEGHIVRKPELLYASVFVNGRIRRIYKFSYGNTSEFIDANGTILHTLATSKSLLSQPLREMKITSAFGLRRHPISGRIKRHDGVDLKAHVGTPIKAPASGVVTEAKC